MPHVEMCRGLPPPEHPPCLPPPLAGRPPRGPPVPSPPDTYRRHRGCSLRARGGGGAPPAAGGGRRRRGSASRGRAGTGPPPPGVPGTLPGVPGSLPGPKGRGDPRRRAPAPRKVPGAAGGCGAPAFLHRAKRRWCGLKSGRVGSEELNNKVLVSQSLLFTKKMYSFT